jgi:alkyl hydroperoxide reductase subunit AhpC
MDGLKYLLLFVKMIHLFFMFKDLEAYGANQAGCSSEFPFPIIDDSDRKLAKQLGMIDPAEFDTKGLPLTARAVC